jgi:hypothetical protein
MLEDRKKECGGIDESRIFKGLGRKKQGAANEVIRHLFIGKHVRK